MIKKLDQHLSPEGLKLLRQLFFFGIVGVSATLTHYLVALCSHNYLGFSLYFANVSGYCAAVAISYFGHGKLTFQRQLKWPVFFRFVLVSLTTLGLSEGILWILLTQFTLHHAISLAIVVCTIPVITFILSKIWVFR